MNYQKHYDTLINRAKNRLLEGYSERHHIIPRCMGGTNRKDNLVTLTAEEHYVAHQLLVKMYPDNDKLIYAAKMMTISGSENVRNNKLYGWLRVKFSASKKEYHKNNPEKHPMNSPETRAKMSVSRKEYFNNPEARAKVSASRKEFYKNNPEARAKVSASRKEFLKNNPEKHPMNSPETRAKISAFMKNNPEKNPMNNPESRAKLSASLKEYHRKKKLANG